MTRTPPPAARLAVLLAALLVLAAAGPVRRAHGDLVADSRAEVIDSVQPKIVKIYGAGGYRGLEAYQSGFLTSAEGHVVTVWSYVLDTEHVTVVLSDGRRFAAQLLGADPRLDVAVLKIEGRGLPHFNGAGNAAEKVAAGTRVLAFSNLFGVATGDEAASVQHGIVAVTAPLSARRGTFETLYHGPVYVLDAVTNNPGAAGGALTNRRGELLGMLGKELRNSQSNAWLNYAIPWEQLAPTVMEIREGRFSPRRGGAEDARPAAGLSPDLVGIVLVPDVLDRTPPFIDLVRRGSPAESAGLRLDDLILFVNGQLVQSCADVVEELSWIDRADPVSLTVMRGDVLVEVELLAPDEP